MFNKIFPKNRAVYDVIWKTLVQLEKTTDDSTKRRMRTASWITKATDTNSEYAIFIASSTAILVLRTRLEYYIIHTLPVNGYRVFVSGGKATWAWC